MSNFAYSDIGTRLLVKEASAYAEFLDISSAPSPKGTPQQLDATVLRSPITQNIKGRADSPILAFEFNHTDANMTKALTVCDDLDHEFLLVYPDNTGWKITGTADVTVNDVSLNSVIKGTLSVFANEVVYVKASDMTALLPVTP